MAVVPVDTPRVQYALDVAVVTRTTNVIHHLVVTALLERSTNASADLGQGLFPGDPLPLSLAAFTDSLQRIKDALRVIDLGDGGWPLGAVPTTTRRVGGVSFELGDLPS